MNDKLKQFTELCFLSRTKGLTHEQHLEKIELVNQMVSEGIMVNDGLKFQFTNESDKEFFNKETMKIY